MVRNYLFVYAARIALNAGAVFFITLILKEQVFDIYQRQRRDNQQT